MPLAGDDRMLLRELDSKYPTSQFHQRSIRSRSFAKHKKKLLGKMGAASKVRNIDPSTVDLSKYGI
jgi:hypothetical protein